MASASRRLILPEMPPSPSTSRRARRRAQRREAGLTLVEMLVVLAIMGVVAGVTLLAIGPADRSRGLQLEAGRLAARLRLAADDVRVAERPLALSWDAHGYGFVDWDAKSGRWVPDAVARLGERHALPGSMTLAITSASAVIPIAADGAGPPIDARLSAGAASWRIAFDGLNAAVSPGAAP